LIIETEEKDGAVQESDHEKTGQLPPHTATVVPLHSMAQAFVYSSSSKSVADTGKSKVVSTYYITYPVYHIFLLEYTSFNSNMSQDKQ